MIKIHNILYLPLFIIYTLFSAGLFVTTSGGWAGLGFLFYGLVGSLILVVYSIIFFITLSFYKIKKVLVNTFLLGLLVIFQLTALLLNTGDGGDNPSICIYVLRYFGIGGEFGCLTKATAAAQNIPLSFLETLGSFALLGYIVLLIFFISYTWAQTVKEGK